MPAARVEVVPEAGDAHRSTHAIDPLSQRGPHVRRIVDPWSDLPELASGPELVEEPLLVHGERDKEARRERALQMLERVGLSAAQAERNAQVRSALGTLPAMDRRILLMTLVQGMKPGAIARRLSLSDDVVRARKSRAIRKVKEYVDRLSRS